VTRVPKLKPAVALWVMRWGLAEMVRQLADLEPDPRVTRRLREAAAAFEAGVSRTDALAMRTER
jgi:hypothetical protein